MDGRVYLEMTMNATVFGLRGRPANVSTSRVAQFIKINRFDKPTLVLDIDWVEANYHALSAGLGHARIHYAVKVNPAREIIARLVKLGAHFDAASRGEIELCLSLGARPDQISFGNTVKRASDIAFAHAVGITLFAADAEAELEKIAANAPGAQVYIRVIVEASEADWPLSRKFGCAGDSVQGLLAHAGALGLAPVGLSFHVGSQTRRAQMWRATLDQVSAIWHSARAAGFELHLLNLGGGFPAFYGEAVEHPTAYAADVMAMVAERFGDVPHIMAEPGRGLVADAGMIAAEVLLVSKKSASDAQRWVYLDIGKFSGLAETHDEAIRYQFMTRHDGTETGPASSQVRLATAPMCSMKNAPWSFRWAWNPVTGS